MKLFYKLLLLSIGCFLLTNGFASAPVTKEKLMANFFHYAQEATIKPNPMQKGTFILTLKGISSLWFVTTRPVKKQGYLTNEEFIRYWDPSVGKDGFYAHHPNAALLGESKKHTILRECAFALDVPKYDETDATISFIIEPFKNAKCSLLPSGKVNDVVLFIDDFPLSW